MKRNEQKLSGVYQCCSVSQTTSVKMAYTIVKFSLKIYIYINRMESSTSRKIENEINSYTHTYIDKQT